MTDWHNMAYLNSGTVTQKAAYNALQNLRVFAILADHHPVLVGTIPINLDIAGSDLDIICQVFDLGRFETLLRTNFGHYPDFRVRHRQHNNLAVIICNFTAYDFPIEIFGQPKATEAQNAYRHMVVEARLLALGNAQDREQIRALKAQGLKTEPAFAEYFALTGDPYEVLLTLADAPDSTLQAVVVQAKLVKQSCIFCQIVSKQATYSLVYEDDQTMAIMNLRQANPGHVLVIPRRHIPQIYYLDDTLAAALMQTVVRVSNAQKKAFGSPGLTIWQSNGAAAGQEIFHLHWHLFPRYHNDGHLHFCADSPPIVSLEKRNKLANRIRNYLQL